MFPPRSPACPRARGPVRCPKGNLRPDLPTGTSPGQPLTWVFPAANCPGLCPVAPVGLTAGTLGSSAHPRRAAITAPTGEPVSCGTRPEHGGKQGDCATRDAFAAFATEAAVVQTAVYYGICSTHFTSSGALLGALAMPCCKQLRGQRSPPPPPAWHPRGGRGGLGPLGEQPGGDALPASPPMDPGFWPEGDGPGAAASHLAAPTDRANVFSPQISSAQGPSPMPRAAHQGCAGLGHGADSHRR